MRRLRESQQAILGKQLLNNAKQEESLWAMVIRRKKRLMCQKIFVERGALPLLFVSVMSMKQATMFMSFSSNISQPMAYVMSMKQAISYEYCVCVFFFFFLGWGERSGGGG